MPITMRDIPAMAPDDNPPPSLDLAFESGIVEAAAEDEAVPPDALMVASPPV